MTYVKIIHAWLPGTLGSESPWNFENAVSFIASLLKGQGTWFPFFQPLHCTDSSSPRIVTRVCMSSYLCHSVHGHNHSIVHFSLPIDMGEGTWVQKPKVVMV